MTSAIAFLTIGGPLSPIPEAVVALLIGLIISVVILVKRIKKRKNGEQASLVGPIVATVILGNLFASAVFLAILGYGIMTSM